MDGEVALKSVWTSLLNMVIHIVEVGESTSETVLSFDGAGSFAHGVDPNPAVDHLMLTKRWRVTEIVAAQLPLGARFR